MAKRNWKPTKEQSAIWKAMAGKTHVIGNALAGTGKTATAVEGVQEVLRSRPRARVGVCAFNVSVEKEIRKLLPLSVDVKTTHKLLFKVLREGVQEKLEVKQDKTYEVLDQIQPDFGFCTILCDRSTCEEHERWKSGERAIVHSLVSLLKNFGIVPPTPKNEEFFEYGELGELERELADIATRHGLLLEDRAELLLPICLTVLWYSNDLSWCANAIDFDDMIYLPYVFDLWPKRVYDLLVVDECQDTNTVQQEMLQRLAQRLMIIGDTNQAIYGFRGADAEAMQNIAADLAESKPGVVSLPLTINWRCPQSAIRLAKRLVPGIQCCDTAPEGHIQCIDENQAVVMMQAKDMVLCRTNAPLVSLAYRLWTMDTKAFVQGRDFSQGLQELVERSKTDSCEDLFNWLDRYLTREKDKLEDRTISRSAFAVINDKVECLRTMAYEFDTIAELQQGLEDLFKSVDTENAVRLSSVHRAKGLEANRVFILQPELMPHPMAEQPWEIEQEQNLAYVAVTRVKFLSQEQQGELYFVGDVPPIFSV